MVGLERAFPKAFFLNHTNKLEKTSQRLLHKRKEKIFFLSVFKRGGEGKIGDLATTLSVLLKLFNVKLCTPPCVLRTLDVLRPQLDVSHLLLLLLLLLYAPGSPGGLITTRIGPRQIEVRVSYLCVHWRESAFVC